MRTAINITGELKYILENDKHHVVVPFHTLLASELIKQEVELVNHDYSVALYAFRYEAETTVGTFRYYFLAEYSGLAGFRPYATYPDLPDNVTPLRDTIDFSFVNLALPSEETVTETEQPLAPAPAPSLWQRLCKKYLPDNRLDTRQQKQQQRGGGFLVLLAVLCAVIWGVANGFKSTPDNGYPPAKENVQQPAHHY